MRSRENLIDRRQLRAWMILNDIRPTDIQKAMGYKKHSPVTDTLRGATDNRRVLGWLKAKGCPVEYLKLPPEMKGESV